MGLFTKKPVTIEARRFETNNDDGSNIRAVVEWIGSNGGPHVTHDNTAIYIDTLEGLMRADVGDWIIRGVKGEFYPCKPDIFAATYAPARPLDVSAMSFGDAIVALKAGERVARAGWNGKGMFLLLVPGSEKLTVDEGRPLAKAGIPVGATFNYLPHIDMWTAQGDLVPWLASQTDVLANDWSVVPNEAS